MGESIFEKNGGRSILVSFAKKFYDKIYDDPWIGLYFKDVDQTRIELQQVDFLQGALGGEKIYCGALPIPAHKHMFISDELFDLRQKYLIEALDEVNAHQDLKDRIQRIDSAFKSGIVKKTIDDCEKRYFTDTILSYDRPK
ncbi:group 1 truncated hemoglobin [Bacteriovoracaceae bacterium]|nr:group 1 truncated hemoglobin [Bacteriovoracaceae bacterium]